MVFFGEYQLNFTSPGRMVLPKKVRELIKGNTFILTKGFDFCLSGFDRQDWEARSQDLFKNSLLDRESLGKQRFLFSSIAYLEIDEQGRFVIPKNLLSHAGLTGKAVIVGVGDHFEIWNPEKWSEYIKANKN